MGQGLSMVSAAKGIGAERVEAQPAATGTSFRDEILPLFRAAPQSGEKGRIRLPESLLPHAADCDEVLLPSGQGLTAGLFLFPSGLGTSGTAVVPRRLVIMLGALGQHWLESHWLWIQRALVEGYTVLALAIDGHSRAGSALFEPRLASRTLPLVLERLCRLPLAPEIHLIGHGFGGTLAWLAACREDAPRWIRSAACLSPWMEWQGQLESQGSIPSLRHPIRLFKDGVKLAKIYGPSGFARLWKGDQVRGMRRQQFVGSSLEAQMAAFLRESVSTKDLVAQCQVPLLVVLPGRGVKASQFFAEDVSRVNALITLARDPLHTARGTQYTDTWLQQVFGFIESNMADKV